jgi:hypothetical protein
MVLFVNVLNKSTLCTSSGRIMTFSGCLYSKSMSHIAHICIFRYKCPGRLHSQLGHFKANWVSVCNINFTIYIYIIISNSTYNNLACSLLWRCLQQTNTIARCLTIIIRSYFTSTLRLSFPHKIWPIFWFYI